jgi:hypothetical protein
MPDWLQVMPRVNPPTCVVDALQVLLLTGDYSRLPTDVGVVALSVIIITGLAL